MKSMLVCFTAMSLISAGSALAGPTSVRVQGAPPGSYQLLAVNVPYGDLDVSTGSGAKALLDRIDVAAQTVCGAKQGKRPAFTPIDAFDTCTARAVQNAVQTVEAPELTKVAAAH